MRVVLACDACPVPVSSSSWVTTVALAVVLVAAVVVGAWLAHRRSRRSDHPPLTR